MRIIFTGGRDYTRRDMVAPVVKSFAGPMTTIVHGGAPGLDTLVDEIANDLDLIVRVYTANWTTHDYEGVSGVRCWHKDDGRSRCQAAGIRRNHEMLRRGADLVVAFPGGTGTEDMIVRSRKAGVPVLQLLEPITK